jgi:hypothetical protein
MALTTKDLESVEKIVDKSNQGLKELFLEKLNGHLENSDRHAKQIDQLYQLDRDRTKELAAIRTDIIRVEGKVDSHAKVAEVEEKARDKREDAVDHIEEKTTQKEQFSMTTWVAIGLAILGPVAVAFILGGVK